MKVKGFFLRALFTLALLLPIVTYAQQVVSLSEYTASKNVVGFPSITNEAGTQQTTATSVNFNQLFAMDFGGNTNYGANTPVTAYRDGRVVFAGNVIKPLYNANFTKGTMWYKTTAEKTIVEWSVSNANESVKAQFQMQMDTNGVIRFYYGQMTIPGASNFTVQVGLEDNDVNGGVSKSYLHTHWNQGMHFQSTPANISISTNALANHPSVATGNLIQFNRYCYHTMEDYSCNTTVAYPTYRWDLDYIAASNEYLIHDAARNGQEGVAHYNAGDYRMDSMYMMTQAPHDTILSFLIPSTTAYTATDYSYPSLYTQQCEHIAVLTLHLGIKSDVYLADTLVCDSYTWNGTEITSSGDYTSVTTDDRMCEVTTHRHFTVRQTTRNHYGITRCDSYTWHNQTYTQSGTYAYTNPVATNGCPLYDTIDLRIKKSTTGQSAMTVCNGYVWNGNSYATTGTYTQTLSNAVGCDSVHTLNLTVNYTTTGTHNATACDSYTWNGVTYTASNHTAQAYLTNAKGCDSIVTLNLVINKSAQKDVPVVACGSWTMPGTSTVYTADGVYEHTYQTTKGCDSVVTYTLTVNRVVDTNIIDSICNGYYNGIYYNVETDLPETLNLQTSKGCDSIVHVIHRVIPRQYRNYVVYSDANYTWVDGNVYTNSTDFLNPPFYNVQAQAPLTNVEAGRLCDSTSFLYFTKEPANFKICKSEGFFEYEGQTINVADSTPGAHYFYKVVSHEKVDSIWALHYEVIDYLTTAATPHTYTYCQDVNVTNIDTTFEGIHFTTADFTTRDQVRTATKKTTVSSVVEPYCDSLVSVTVVINPIITNNVLVASHCEGVNYTHTYAAEEFGLAEDATVEVPASALVFANLTADAGKNYRVYTQQDVFQSALGCDYIINTTINVYPTRTGVDTVHYCVNYDGSYTVKNYDGTAVMVFNAEDLELPVVDTNMHVATVMDPVIVTSSFGCDSIVTIVFMGHGVIMTELDSIIDNNGHYVYNGVQYDIPSAEEYLHTVIYSTHGQSYYGCDSNYFVHLYVGRTKEYSYNIDTCQEYYWTIGGVTHRYQWFDHEHYQDMDNGTIFKFAALHDQMTDSIPTITLRQSNGIFDSVSYLYLTLAEGISTFTNAPVVSMHDVYRQSSDYTFTYADSTFDFAAAREAKKDTIIDHTYHFSTLRYCDSIDHVHFFVDYTSADTYIHDTLFLSDNNQYVFDGNVLDFDSLMTSHNGTVLDTTFIYSMEDYSNVSVCDSNVHLNLVVVYNYDTAAIDTICIHQHEYTLPGTEYTIATVPADEDFDTIYKIDTLVMGEHHKMMRHFEIYQLRKLYGTDYVFACDEFTWINGRTYTENTTTPTHLLPGASVRYHCDSLVTLNLQLRPSAHNATVVTACDEYTWEGHTYTNTTKDTIVFVERAANGCDSTVTLDLTINRSLWTNVEACNDNVNIGALTYTWTVGQGNYTHTHNYSFTEAQAGDYHFYDTIIGNQRNGCNQYSHLLLHVKAPVYSEDTVWVCNENAVWDLNHTNYTYNPVTGLYAGALDGERDGSHIAYWITERDTACGNAPKAVTYLNLVKSEKTYGIYYTENEYYCDSYTWFVENPFTGNTDSVGVYTENSKIPFAASYDFNITNPRTHCDSIVYLDLTIHYKDETEAEATVCAYEMPYTYEFAGEDVVMTEAGVHTLMTQNIWGCDSIENFTLTVLPVTTTTIHDTICLGSDYYQYGFNLNHYTNLRYSGDFEFSNPVLNMTSNCYDTVKLFLHVLPTSSQFVHVSSCRLPYSWYVDEEYDRFREPGTARGEDLLAYIFFTDDSATTIITNHFGCDSTIHLRFTVGTPYETIADPIVVCDANTYTFTSPRTGATQIFDIANGAEQMFQEVIALDTIAYACDSLYTYPISFRSAVNSTFAQTACDQFTWIDGITYTASNNTATYVYANGAANGCDSIVTLDLTVNHSTSNVITATACDSYIWTVPVNGYSLTLGAYTSTPETRPEYHTVNAMGCDSVVYLDLTVNYSAHATDVQVACDQYTWINGNTYIANNTVDQYTYEGGAQNGCDSIVTLNLTINHSTTATISQVACDQFTWFGDNLTSTGVYTHVLVGGNHNNCDSIINLVLVINESKASEFYVTACDSYLWEGYRSNSGDYTHTYVAANGCDSVVTLHLTINHSNTGVHTVTACDSYVWEGTTYTASNNTATHTYTNVAGCDSVVTLNLTVNYSTTGVVTATACDSYTWHGNTYSASTNNAIYYSTNAAGCQHTDTLHLTVNYSTSSNTIVTACDSYTWNGTTYTSSATPTLHFTNAAGCDSAATLHLTINYSNTGVHTVTACDSYVWEGTTYTASNNTATHTYNNASGCDSVVTLNLTINYSNGSTNVVTVCDSYTWVDGVTYTSSTNVPVFHYTNVAGCDSAVALNLTVNYSTTGSDDITACDTYTWGGQEYTTSGVYTHTFQTVHGCDSVVTLSLTVNYSTSAEVYEQGSNSFTWNVNGQTYTESGTYNATITNVAGCDSNVTMHLVLIMGRPLPQIVAYNGRVVMVNHYPFGKSESDYIDYDGYQWFKDGQMIDNATLDYYCNSDYTNLSGCYYVAVPTAVGSNEWVTSNTICLGSANGIEEVTEQVEFTVAPNPVMNGRNLRISTNLDDVQLNGARIVMYDLRGRVVYNEAMDAAIVNIPVNQATGAYMIRIVTANGESSVKKVIVK